MGKGLGRVERWIEEEIVTKEVKGHSVLLHSWGLACNYRDYKSDPHDWKPSQAQRTAVVRAMHSYVRKFPQYALMGGRGHEMLYLYDPSDPISTIWAMLSVERRGFVSDNDARQYLNKVNNPRPSHAG
jgi:hypothetical protein